MALDHMYHEQCGALVDGQIYCPHKECRQTVDFFETALEFSQPRAPEKFIRVTDNSGEIAVLVLIGLAKNQVVSEKCMSQRPFGQLDEKVSLKIKNHLRLNSMIPLAMSAEEISCARCQLLIQTILTLSANFSIEPLAFD